MKKVSTPVTIFSYNAEKFEHEKLNEFEKKLVSISEPMYEDCGFKRLYGLEEGSVFMPTVNGSVITTFVYSERKVVKSILKAHLRDWIAKEEKLRGARVPRIDVNEKKEQLEFTFPFVDTEVLCVFDKVNGRIILCSQNKKVVNAFTTVMESILDDNFQCIDVLGTDGDTTESAEMLTFFWYAMESDSFMDFGGKVTPTACWDVTVTGEDKESCKVKGMALDEARKGVFNGKRVSEMSVALLGNEERGGQESVVLTSERGISKLMFEVDEKDPLIIGGHIKRGVDDALEFIRVMAGKYAEETSKDNLDRRSAYYRGRFNWSKGDICVKAFEEV